jgi:ribonuclease HI
LTILQSISQSPSPKISPPPKIDHSSPGTFFDGATHGSPSFGVAGGIFIWMLPPKFPLQHLGEVNNNFNEFMVVKLLITLAIEKGITHINIFRDSMLVIN